MSIRIEINWRLNEQRLFHLKPALSDVQVVRTILVAPEIHALVVGPWTNRELEYRGGYLRGDLDTFTTGGLISVGIHPYKKKKTAYMVRLDEPSDEVWEIRSRDPKPAVRVFGRFAETDVFVALTWSFRTPLGGPGSREWRDEIEKCKAEWRKLFVNEPVSRLNLGVDINDYISGNVFLV